MQQNFAPCTNHNEHRQLIRWWLASIAMAVYAMMLVGGLTRLTDSGLSITQWKPVTGVIPPMSDQDWNDAFTAYKNDTYEYKAQNHTMKLGQFKVIYWWEWSHRMLGRMIGLVFVIPLGFFIARGWIAPRLMRSLLGLLALGAFQGWIGWWMVASGIDSQLTDVAPMRLMVHFALALLIIAWCSRLWLDLGHEHPIGTGRAWALVLTSLVTAQMLLGALTAGLDGGKIYTDWPLMNGHLVAPEVWSPGSFIDNPAAAQLAHRLCAYLLTAGTLCAAMLYRNRPNPGFGTLALLVAAQSTLGIITLVNTTPLVAGIAHQALGITIAVWTLRCLWMTQSSKQPLT